MSLDKVNNIRRVFPNKANCRCEERCNDAISFFVLDLEHEIDSSPEAGRDDTTMAFGHTLRRAVPSQAAFFIAIA